MDDKVDEQDDDNVNIAGYLLVGFEDDDLAELESSIASFWPMSVFRGLRRYPQSGLFDKQQDNDAVMEDESFADIEQDTTKKHKMKELQAMLAKLVPAK